MMYQDNQNCNVVFEAQQILCRFQFKGGQPQAGDSKPTGRSRNLGEAGPATETESELGPSSTTTGVRSEAGDRTG